MSDDEYDDDELRLPDDDCTENDEVSDLTDLEVGGVVMADFGLDMSDDFDSEPIRKVSSRGTTGKKAASAGRTRKPKRAGLAGKLAKKKTAGRVKKKTVSKVARKAAKKTTKKPAKKTAKKTRRAVTRKPGAAKAARKVWKKK